MSWITGADETPPELEPSNPNLQPEAFKGIEVDSKFVPHKMLLSHVSGYLMIADAYFSQYINVDNELAAQEINRPGAYQQYLRINNLEMRVQDPLSASQDQTSKEFTYDGSAIIYAPIVPNKGDMFLTDIGDGKAGIFTITSATQASVLMDTVYVVEYTLVVAANVRKRMEDLVAKVVKEVWYHKDFMSMGKDPFLVDTEHQAVLNFNAILQRLPQEYYESFLHDDYKTFIVPDQDLHLYDPFLAEYVNKTTSLNDTPLYLHASPLNTQDGMNDQRVTLWDAIARRDYQLVDRITPKMSKFVSDPNYYVLGYSSWRASRIPGLFFHDGAKTSLGVQTPLFEGLKSSPTPTFNRPMDLFKLIQETELYGLPIAYQQPRPLIHPVTIDTFYVLSEAFYKEEFEKMSLLELLVCDYLKQKPVSPLVLEKILRQYDYWPSLERFYYLPLVITLLKSCFKDIN